MAQERTNWSSMDTISQEQVVHQISKSLIGPSSSQGPRRCDLTPWDLAMLSICYIQKGLLFTKPRHHPPSSQQQLRRHQEKQDPSFIQRLKLSLSHALAHFFPLAGGFVTERHQDSEAYNVYIDCNTAAGAEFIHATAHVTISDILKPTHIPKFVESLFPLNEAINHDGHTLPLLAVQVTELVDGIFIGCSLNHASSDGTSFWHFFNIWSEICRGNDGVEHISRPPIIDRCTLSDSSILLPLSGDEFTERYKLPPLKQRIFHFTSVSIARLKAKANEQRKTDRISSFQALVAHLWRSVTKARALPSDQNTTCDFAVDNRSRLEPPLSPNCFGCYVQLIGPTITAGELLWKDLGWAAWLLFDSVAAHTDSAVRSLAEAWVRTPLFPRLSGHGSSNLLIMSSPRFDIYENDFGWGRPIAMRSGLSNKFDGVIGLHPGRKAGSVDVEVCLSPNSSSVLELDEEFMATVVKINPIYC